METFRVLAISLLLAACSKASATHSCHGDLIAEQRCQNWVEKACNNSRGSSEFSPNCTKIQRCVCPEGDLLRYNDRCYKSFECPKKSADTMSDARIGHNFIIPGQVNNLNEVYGMHISALKLPPHWYHAVALFRILDANCAQMVRAGHAKDIVHNLAINYDVPIKLVDLLQQGHVFKATFGTRSGLYFKKIGKCKVRVDKVLDLRRYKSDEPYPVKQKYFLFGDSSNAYITHIPTRCKDFQQIAWLNRVPPGFDNLKLRAGEVVYLPELKGDPTFNSNGQIADPLSKHSYLADYDCQRGQRNEANEAENDLRVYDKDDQNGGCKSTNITIKKKYPFDSAVINILCS